MSAFPHINCIITARASFSCAVADFPELAQRESLGGACVVLTGSGSHELNRRSFAFLQPAAILTTRGHDCAVDIEGDILRFDADPFELLGALARAADAHEQHPVPLMAGYVAYEAGRLIERLPMRTRDALGLPDLFFLLPTRVLRLEHASGICEAFHLDWQLNNRALPRLMRQPLAALPRKDAPRALVTRAAYEDAVRSVRDAIRDGEVYQVNLSQRFIFGVADAHALWRGLLTALPAPFHAWIRAMDHDVFSTSMERFVSVNGRDIETRPIKGTRPRAADAAEDAALTAELLSSPKDDAELSMIVDLERNDLGRICTLGSVTVSEHKRLERYAHVQHLVSVVRGSLREGVGIAEVFRALFPGGSITGCPKIRAMEIIDALEPVTRHVYTGAIGYIAANGDCDFNIAIRSGVVKDGQCHYSVGGGIVYDSDPAAEYEETLHKGAGVLRVATTDGAEQEMQQP